MDENDFWRRERIAFLGLTTLKGVGFWTLHKINEAGATFLEALRSPEEHGIEKHLQALTTESIDIDDVKELVWKQGIGLARKLFEKDISLHFREEATFPWKLKEIPDAPWWIFVEGSLGVLSSPSCAIVGTRKASEDGIFLTRLVVTSLAGKNLVTVSGLAQGIDQVAHAESIRYGIPTIAVLGTGILNNYPKGSEALRASIVKYGGAIISEYLPGQSYSAENFVRRNRLQAALGDVLIPTEWAVKSGTAHTVKYASRYNKKIINVYLPRTIGSRPDIDFSKKEYSALACELPRELEVLQNELQESTDTILSTPSNDVVENKHGIDCDKSQQEGQFELDI